MHHSGKTGVYLHLIGSLRQLIGEEVEVDDSSSDENEQDETTKNTFENFEDRVPYHKVLDALEKLPTSIKSGKYCQYAGAYNHPPESEEGPVLPKVRKSRKPKQRTETVKHSVCTYTSIHSERCPEKICKQYKSKEITIMCQGRPCTISYPDAEELAQYQYLFGEHRKNACDIVIMTPSKGQIISEANSIGFNSPKKQTKFFKGFLP